VPSRLTSFWKRPSRSQRLSEVEELCRGIGRRLDALARDGQRSNEQQILIETRLSALDARLASAEAAIDARVASVEAALDVRLAATEAALARAAADIERVHREEAALRRVVSSLPAFADIAEEVRSLRIAQAALQVQVQRAPVPEPDAAVEPLHERIDALKAEVGRLSRFVLKTADDRVPAVPPAEGPRPRLEDPLPLAAQLERLEAMAPRTFDLWKELLEYNRQSYTGFPVHSCSVEGHPSAAMFTQFVNQFLRGDVLDIGCGPQPVPLYLQQYAVDRIYGIDPISTAERHPFHFHQGVAEFLPWNDGSFDVAIAATSLDHVLFLDEALREIHRVLKADGEFLVWVAFVAGSVPYDPHAPDIQPVDEYHLFHFSEEFFDRAVAPFFTVRDKLRVNLEIDHHFYRLGRRAVPAEGSTTMEAVSPIAAASEAGVE
jgi:SAM-dependent methyltransferase